MSTKTKLASVAKMAEMLGICVCELRKMKDGTAPPFIKLSYLDVFVVEMEGGHD